MTGLILTCLTGHTPSLTVSAVGCAGGLVPTENESPCL